MVSIHIIIGTSSKATKSNRNSVMSMKSVMIKFCFKVNIIKYIKNDIAQLKAIDMIYIIVVFN